jgi:hypothetical protein
MTATFKKEILAHLALVAAAATLILGLGARLGG